MKLPTSCWNLWVLSITFFFYSFIRMTTTEVCFLYNFLIIWSNKKSKNSSDFIVRHITSASTVHRGQHPEQEGETKATAKQHVLWLSLLTIFDPHVTCYSLSCDLPFGKNKVVMLKLTFSKHLWISSHCCKNGSQSVSWTQISIYINLPFL